MGEGAAQFAKDQLKAFVERIERVEAEVAELNSDKSDLYKEAKSVGFDPKILKRVVAWRRRDRNEAAEEEALFDLYRQALGMLPDETGMDVANIDRAPVHAREEPAVLPTPARRVAEQARAPLTDQHGLMIEDVPAALRVRA